MTTTDDETEAANQMEAANNLYHQDLGGILNSPDFSAFHTLGENIIVTPPGYSPQQIEAAWMMSATLSTDHRAVDGALGAQLLGAFKALIENPVMMVV